jgi:hypothetical protein
MFQQYDTRVKEKVDPAPHNCYSCVVWCDGIFVVSPFCSSSSTVLHYVVVVMMVMILKFFPMVIVDGPFLQY